MGADQSRPNGGSAEVGGATRQECYYDILGVAETATEDELKRAYRTKALELHPDRNYHDVENATARFAAVQTAYEILSDAQERAWYDSHRDIVLGAPNGGAGSGNGQGVQFSDAGQIVALMGKFSNVLPMNDVPTGFYGGLNAIFETLAAEEEAACRRLGIEPVDYPGFGSLHDDYESVKPFYKVWQSFSTHKSFSWKDLYAPSEGPDRATRRVIDRENKKSRDDAIRDFNDAIRHLVLFVRKRDSRWLPNTKPAEDLQQKLREAAAAQAARSRAANRANLGSHTLPAWAESHASDRESGASESEPSEDELEEIECVPCRKIFKSEQQFEAHARSKKHIKAARQIARQMKEDVHAFDLDSTAAYAKEFRCGEESANDGNGFVSQTIEGESFEKGQSHVSESRRGAALNDVASQEKHAQMPDADSEVESHKERSQEQESDDDYASRATVESRLLADDLDTLRVDHRGSQQGDKPSPAKLGKAKAKRAKKAAHQSNGEADLSDTFTCTRCHESFPSKTKMFKHIKDQNHAQPINGPAIGKKKSRR